MTNSRRNRIMPQLVQIGKNYHYNYYNCPVKTVECKKIGFNDFICKDVDNNFNFSKVVVTCEGYDHKYDPYILVNSCRLEYELANPENIIPVSQNRQRNPEDKNKDDPVFVLPIIFALLICLMVSLEYRRNDRNDNDSDNSDNSSDNDDSSENNNENIDNNENIENKENVIKESTDGSTTEENTTVKRGSFIISDITPSPIVTVF